jgi:hypothetical protein
MKSLTFILTITLFLNISWGATYYIDFASGNDSADGRTKETPWKRHPYMVGWSGSYTHVAGDRFLFKGGTTWPYSCFPLTLAAGGSATAGNDYYGVDKEWFSGPLWSRPAFDGGYAVAYIFFLGPRRSYVTIDNLELRYINAGNPLGPGLIYGTSPTHLLITNSYLHGWRTSAATDDAHGAIMLFYGTRDPRDNVIVEYCEIENSENSGPNQNGVAIRQVREVRHCIIRDVSSAVLFTANFHDNIMYNVGYPKEGPRSNQTFDPAYHTNTVYMAAFEGTLCFNNILYDCPSGSGYFYPNPAGGQTMRIFNNVVYGEMTTNGAVLIDTYNGGVVSGGNGIVHIVNNTFVVTSAPTAVRVLTPSATRPPLDELIITNNHIISPGASLSGAVQGVHAVILTAQANLFQSPEVATLHGYLVSNNYAPTEGTGPTVRSGVSTLSLSVTFDIRRQPREETWDIGAYQYVFPPSNASVQVSIH